VLSYDVVALLAKDPGMGDVARALRDAGPDEWIRPLDGGLLQVRDEERRVVATLESSQLVESRDEVARLLGEDAAAGLPDPCWWVEVRARPDERGREAAHRIADHLAWRLNGTVWTSGPADLCSWEDTGHPAVERTTEQAFVVVQDREVVPLSSWISDAVSVHARKGRAFQLLTPHTARVTHALRTLLTSPMARWVVRGEDGVHFDGVSGRPLDWEPDQGYVPRPDEQGSVAPPDGFLDDAPLNAQLVLDLTVRHTEPYAPPLGRAVELITEYLAGAVPAGWGVHEPALAAWEPDRFVRMARHRAPRPMVLHFSGPRAAEHPFAGSARVTWDGEYGGERISLVVGYEHEKALPLDELPGLAVALADHGLLDMLHVRRIRGRADLTYAPRWHGLAAPVGLAVGPGRVAEIGRERAVAGPIPGALVGDGDRPAAWCPVRGAGGLAQTMDRLRDQMAYLGTAPTR
jgi:hypothetical protein